MATVRGKRRDVLEMYRRIRPVDVPAEMVEAATARRMAGDVAGAFAAARVDLDVDVTEVTRMCGRETADLVVDDLRHLAPDLLRWNIPRALSDGAPIGNLLLRRYSAGGGANLMVGGAWKQPERLRLSVRTSGAGVVVLPDRAVGMYHLPRAYWDVRCGGELRGLCGAGPDRIPFHSVDGRLLDGVDSVATGLFRQISFRHPLSLAAVRWDASSSTRRCPRLSA
jgi:hypothetical protein